MRRRVQRMAKRRDPKMEWERRAPGSAETLLSLQASETASRNGTRIAVIYNIFSQIGRARVAEVR